MILPIKITRPLVVLDCEATGTEVTSDAIWELGMVTFWPKDSSPKFENLLIKPWKEVPKAVEEAIGRHGVNELVATAPTFKQLAKRIHESLIDCDFAGFNLRRFDLAIIQEELWRCGIDWDPTKSAIIDAGTIFKIKEERTLSAAVRFYCGREHKDAHNALSDSEATADVLWGQLARYPDLKVMNLEQLAKASQHEDYIDLAGKFAWNEAGEVIFTFGAKTKGQRVLDNPGMLEWVLDKDFPRDTKNWCQKFLKQIYTEREESDPDFFNR